jgi:hypothetical protein
MADYAAMTDENQAAPSVLAAAPSATHPAGCNALSAIFRTGHRIPITDNGLPMSNFEWYTDEDGDWEELAPPLPPPQAVRKRWFVWLVVLIVVTLATSTIYQRLNQRATEVGAIVADEVLSSHQLRQKAVITQDRELFDSILSGSNSSWMQAQQTLFEHHLTLDRWPLGLELPTADAQLLAINPVPDLKAAELLVAQEYVIRQPDGVQTSVTLHRTDIYRRGQQRWLYAPPPQEFWGEWQTAGRRYLTLIYPQRDQTIAQQLLADFDNTISIYCEQPQAHCPSDLRLLVRFDTNPQSLLDLSNLTTLWQSRSSLKLPTPSLIGMPIDEAGYQALLRGYSSQVVATTIQKTIGWPCCSQGLFHQALIDKQLSQMGLKSWPLAAEHYATLFQSPIMGIDQLDRFWHEPPIVPLSGSIWPQIYSAVDFILARVPGVSLPEIQRQLLAAGSYTDWLHNYLPAHSNTSLRDEWLHFAQSHLPAETAVPLPDQDILLLCRSATPGINQTSLFRYNPQNDTINADLDRRHFLFMTPLPHDEGVLLHERQPLQNRTQLILWQNRQETVAADQSLSTGLFHVEPISGALTLYSYDFAENQSLLDHLVLAACGADGCPMQRLGGTPYWSPDGRHALLVTDQEHLWLADSNGHILHDIGTGTAPFWLNETHYGYAHVAGNLNRIPAELVVTAVTNNQQPQSWLALAELAPALPESVRLNQLTIRAIVAAPHNPDLLFIATNARPRRTNLRTLLFAYDQSTRQIKLIYSTRYTLGFYKPITFSADGNWLATTAFAHTNTLSELFLYHIPSGHAQILGSNHAFSALEYDWSADSQWLLRLENGFLHLIEPLSGAQKIFVHDLPGCRFAAWVN